MHKLEVELGPDTAALDVRIGIHSGPVTAGVLRGKKSRFQLFGDSMNKASRIESSGMPGRIHLSLETAELLISYGKGHWVTPREDKVAMKGLKDQSTYWLNPRNEGSVLSGRSGGDASTSSSLNRSTQGFSQTHAGSMEGQRSMHRSKSSSSLVDRMRQLALRTPKLVEWNAKVLAAYLQEIVFRRQLLVGDLVVDDEKLSVLEKQAQFGNDYSSLGIISFQRLHPDQVSPERDLPALDPEVMSQLTTFVQSIAELCNPYFFHNFEQCSHMVMSVRRMLIQAAAASRKTESCPFLVSLDDPTAHFVLLLAAMIRNVGHPGISNQQLIQQGHGLTVLYNSNFAERNALDMAWDVLKKDNFLTLRRTIYRTEAEFEYWRALLVQAAIVADVNDKNLMGETEKRWMESFGDKDHHQEAPINLNQMKTALFEQSVQISVASHAMQNWKVYKRWNTALLDEQTKAFNELRIDQSPSEYWFKQELEYLDTFVLPLARRTMSAQIFRTIGEEAERHAWSNRCQWEQNGNKITGSDKEH